VYEIRWSDDAWADLQALPAFHRRRVANAVDNLVHGAEITTRNRKRLDRILPGLEDAEWNMRVGDFRVLYRIVDGRIARILRVILKGTATTEQALGRSVKQ
jgi:mRNA-degrading endonuclease RelE of RelBE toxin-antitoxin system